MTRRPARAILSLVLAGSLCATLWSGWRIAQNPALRPLVELQGQALAAALDRATARAATPEAIAARLDVLLSEDPRNWLAIEAVEQIAAERGTALPPALAERSAALWAQDNAFLTRAGRCAECVWDPASCSLSNAFLCQAPVAITPVGDVLGIGRAGVAAATGAEVDGIDLALSLAGLGATAAIIASGGSSASVKAGAGALKVARRMDLVSPRLTATLADAAKRGIVWDDVLRLDSLTDPARLIRPGVLAPVAAIGADLARTAGALNATRTLHLMRHIDDATDARRIADAAQAAGPRVVGQMELLGKSRFLRAGLRLGDEAAALLAGLAGLVATLGSMAGTALGNAALRGLRRVARRA
jgi:hypothetical protein